MTTLVTALFNLALPWLLWMIWRAAERADQEVETLAQRHRFAHVTQPAGGATSKPDSSRAIRTGY
jgi:hypothetical protein